MLSLVKKRKDASATSGAPKAAFTDARAFIPVHSHYNAHTLITKNGELIQTLRIGENLQGLTYEPPDGMGGLREAIRRALQSQVQGAHIAVWVHTLRKRRAVSFDASYENPFAAHVSQGWRSKHGWSHRYYNEVYITLVYEGQQAKLTDADMFRRGATRKKNRELRDTYLEAASAELDLIAGSVSAELERGYRVRRLQVAERMPPGGSDDMPAEPVYYSEPMEFLSYLLNLREEEIPLPDADISACLQSCELIFGFNALETKNDDGVKRFGAILSLKQYREVPPDTVDMLLQAPMELIVSQAFHFIPGDVALKNFREQKDYFEMSGDEFSMRASGISDMLRNHREHETDFGWQQTNITVLVDELKQINEDITGLQSAFAGLGIICVREDIKLEEIFWSNLPGNFTFLRRRTPIPTSLVSGFAKLNRYASGESEHTFWKEPVALLPTMVNSPYFFNFHVQDNGHTLLLDFNSFGDRLANQSLMFLLTSAHKLNPKLYYFDYQGQAELWFDKMGADYAQLRPQRGGLAINPFSLPEHPRNIGFLGAWCAELVRADEQERAVLRQAVAEYYNGGGERHLEGFVSHLREHAPALAGRFAPWLPGGASHGLFSERRDEFDQKAARWLGVDLTHVFNTPENAVAAFAYLLHRIILSLTGEPTIIVLQHAFPILQQPFFASRLSSLMEMLKENNAMLVLCVRYSDTLPGNPVAQELIANCATAIIVPDDLDLNYIELFPSLLTADDHNQLLDMQRMKGDVLVKQDGQSVGLKINLDAMPDVAAIFANDVKTLISAGGPFASLPRQASNG